MRRAVLPAVLAIFGASAASASAADVTISGFEFKPTPVTIAQGDSVTWHYAGPDTNHSVTADPMQADSWDSDPTGPPGFATHPIGTTFAHRFDVQGSFTYFCKVHSTMRGRVIVRAPGADVTPPKVTALKATGGRTCPKPPGKCRARPTAVTFKLSEAANVKLTVPGKPKAAVTRAAKKGANTVRISTKVLPPGSYKVNVVATDAAGNRSAKAQTSVQVKRG
jgi:plastocyanin